MFNRYNKYIFLVIVVLFITEFVVKHSYSNVQTLRSSGKISKLLKHLTLKRSRADFFCKTFFPPDDDVTPLLLGLIQAESDCSDATIDVAAYQMTSKPIAQALHEAHKKGVKIRIVADVSALGSRFDQIRGLHGAGIPVNIYPAENQPKQYSLMHNKFMIFGQILCVLTGSMNFTNAGIKNNQENVLVIQNYQLTHDYKQQFERLLGRSTKL